MTCHTQRQTWASPTDSGHHPRELVDRSVKPAECDRKRAAHSPGSPRPGRKVVLIR